MSGPLNNSQVGFQTGRYPIMLHSINGMAYGGFHSYRFPHSFFLGILSGIIPLTFSLAASTITSSYETAPG